MQYRSSFTSPYSRNKYKFEMSEKNQAESAQTLRNSQQQRNIRESWNVYA